MDFRFEKREDGVVFTIVLIVTDGSGVETVYPIATPKARNLNAQLTAVLKTGK